MLSEIKNISKEFFENMQLEIESIEVLEEGNNIFLIILKTKDSWIAIWPQWKNLDHIKKILKMILTKKLETDIFIHLEVNDYLKEKEEKLINFIKTKIDYVKKTWKSVRLPLLSSYERKKIHWYVSTLWDDLYTKSSWEWKERRLYIYKQDIKLSIDIDWDNI